MEWLEDPSKWRYRGEGNATLVIANAESQQVLRLKKVFSNSKQESSDETNIEAAKLNLAKSINFCRDVFVPLLSEKYVHPGAIVQLPNNFITDICNLVSSGNTDRPVHRRTKEVASHCQFGVLMPDFCFAPGEDCSKTSATICIEIKPKCGVLPTCNNLTPMCNTYEKIKQSVCKYCLIQWLKVNEQRKYNRKSKYCPSNLFSNDPRRVFYAISSLFEDPQNNLKIFKDGKMIFSGETNLPSDGLATLPGSNPPSNTLIPSHGNTLLTSEHIDQALLENCTIAEKNLPSTSDPSGNHPSPPFHPLGKILSGEHTLPDANGETLSQEITNLEVILGTIFSSHTSLENSTEDGGLPYSLTTMLQLLLLQIMVDDSKNLSTSNDSNTVTTTPVCAESNYMSSQFNKELETFLKSQTFGNHGVLNKILGAQNLDTIGTDSAFQLYQDITTKPNWNKNLYTSNFSLLHGDCSLIKNGPSTDIPLEYFNEQTLTEEKHSSTSILDEGSTSLSDIARFLVAASANDCSIMIAFQKVDSVTPGTTASYIKDAITGLVFKYSIAVVDLDPKTFNRIPRYYHEYHDIIENYLQYSNKFNALHVK